MKKEVNDLKIHSVVHKSSTPVGTTHSRKIDGLCVRVTGTMKYYFRDKTITVNAGEMIFLPKGSIYKYMVTSEGPSICTIINLEGDLGENEPTAYSLDTYHYSDCLMSNFAEMWNFGSISDRYQCMAYVYDLMSFMSKMDAVKYPERKKFEIIEPAVEYLKKHIYDTTLSIDKLHKLCGVSHTYFRKIFIMKFGMSPKNYVIDKRMIYARSIVDSGEFQSVRQLSLAVGYSDPLYFSKVFKKHFGVSPIAMKSTE